ncbi:type II toxin-antitoxin system RatA family toxin [Aureimonas altamirensis]|jgi:coenzyme Q-binding protein COQ10|uniref:type II toxin-antitoxin system RatA family toxin n=1 Tax=Aureimonas altamirensis TaxID=370622 RepID=UPI001E3B4B50|nr:type II toxin-antitoxin system RatA family toxin [Aureimonas altamirensis]UHD44328.1 type II toxin-antitoxin system RatA family toxin [Aureimonas altamirensis]
MPKFESTRIVTFTPRQMFDLVADVERYPEFVPLCERLTIRTRREREGTTLLVADMTVAYKMIRESFATQVLLDPDKRQIDVEYIDGPFRFLRNQWRFEDDPKGCRVVFFIEYEFKNRALGMVMGSMFDYAFRRFAVAFEERAAKVYAAPAA